MTSAICGTYQRVILRSRRFIAQKAETLESGLCQNS